MIDYFSKIQKIINNYVLIIKKTAANTALLIKLKYKYFKFLLPILKYIYYNPFYIFILICIISSLFSLCILNFLFMFMLVNSFIISLLILHNVNIKKYSKKLSKNVLSMFILYLNPMGSLITLLIVSILYSNYSKITSKLIIKILESIVIFIFSVIPFLKYIYPDSKYIKNNNPIEYSNSSKNDESLDNLSSNK